MASKPPPTHSEIGDQPPTEDAPPAYDDDATGALDIRQDGLSAQTQVGLVNLPLSLPSHDLSLPKRPDDGRVDIRINEI